MSDAARILLCTCPDEATAARIARALVEERLAACVNRLGGMRSTYRWKDAVEDEAEWLLVVKSVAARVPALTRRIVELHPYELPEVVAVEVAGGHPPYLAWIADATRD